MSVLLEKLKNLFSSNGLSTSTTKKQSALPTCIKTNEEPDLNWNIAEQIGDGAFGKIFRVIIAILFILYCNMKGNEP